MKHTLYSVFMLNAGNDAVIGLVRIGTKVQAFGKTGEQRLELDLQALPSELRQKVFDVWRDIKLFVESGGEAA